jgi:acyl dehydratase
VSTPDSVIYADDLNPGEEIDLGFRTLSADEIIAFARDWDPQVFHVDAEGARDTFFGQLVASGVQSMAVMQRMMVDVVFSTWAIQAGKAITDLRFRIPVTPGMRLHGVLRIDEVTAVRPGTASVKQLAELRDDNDRVVFSEKIEAYVATREGAPAESTTV